MTLITNSITGRWRFKGPGHIARMYGGGLHENLIQSRWDLSGHRMKNGALVTRTPADIVMSMDFASIEKRILGFYSGYDPRNHFGKFANRRYIK